MSACNEKQGTNAGHARHKAAGETPCTPCIEAYREYHRNYYKANSERASEKNREWRRKNADYLKAYKAENYERDRQVRLSRYADNAETLRLKRREYYAANAERERAYAREYMQKYRQEHPDYMRQYKAANPERIREHKQRRYALEKATTVLPFTAEQLSQRMAYYGHKYYICGGPFEHIDHVKPLAKGGLHALVNLRPACASCNRSKNAQWPYDFKKAA